MDTTTFSQPQTIYGYNLSELSQTQATALELHAMGLNAFPIPHAEKGGWPWHDLQITRLLPNDLVNAFYGLCNIAVMAGRTSQNLFVLDCETAASFTAQETLLRAADIPIFAVRSGSKRGGGHFYLLCAEGEVRNIGPGKLPEMEVRGNRCYVVCPPSIHPKTKKPYTWQRETPIPPIVSITQLPWLGLKTVKSSKPLAQYQPGEYPMLSKRNQEFIQSGAYEGERNIRLFAAACDMHGHGLPIQEAMSQLADAAIHSGLPRAEVLRTINNAYSQPRDPARPPLKYAHDHSEEVKKARIAAEWGKNHEWRGRTAASDRAVFLACCQRAMNDARDGVFRASCREVAEGASISYKTTAKTLKRLCEMGILEWVDRCAFSKANRYRFARHVLESPSGRPDETLENIQNGYTTCVPLGDTCSVPVLHTTALPIKTAVSAPEAPPEKEKPSIEILEIPYLVLTTDIAERGAVGQHGHHLYRMMVAAGCGPFTRGELMALSKLSSSQFGRAVNRLIAFGLVLRVARGVYMAVPKSDEELDREVSLPAQTLGKREERKKLHQKQRAYRAAARLYKHRWDQDYTWRVRFAGFSPGLQDYITRMEEKKVEARARKKSKQPMQR